MTWWDNLWLNEGFATWMESKATEHFHPRWQTWLNNYDEKQGTMRQDANGTAHPIHRPVSDKSEASEMFDDITYNKAGAVVRMLEGYLGPEVFRAGVRKYVTDHAYGNTTPADLWRALEAVSGKPVTAVATAFIEQSGVPLVIADTRCIDGAQRVTLRQERFTLPRRRAGARLLADPDHRRTGEGAASARTRPADAGAARGRRRPLRRSRQAQCRRHRLLPGAVRRHDARGADQVVRAACRRPTASTCSPTPGRWWKPAAARRPPISIWSSRSATTAVRSGTR